jgi:hypothetical protein
MEQLECSAWPQNTKRRWFSSYGSHERWLVFVFVFVKRRDALILACTRKVNAEPGFATLPPPYINTSINKRRNAPGLEGRSQFTARNRRQLPSHDRMSTKTTICVETVPTKLKSKKRGERRRRRKRTAILPVRPWQTEAETKTHDCERWVWNRSTITPVRKRGVRGLLSAYV